MARTPREDKKIKNQMKAIPAEVRHYALVGYFMSEWAGLEARINDCIEKAFGLNAYQAAILVSNLGFFEKVQIVRTCISEAVKNAAERKKMDAVLTSITEYSKTRNIIAHHSFFPDPDVGGALINSVKARGKLVLENMPWSIEKFHDQAIMMQDFAEEVRKLYPVLDAYGATSRSARAARG